MAFKLFTIAFALNLGIFSDLYCLLILKIIVYIYTNHPFTVKHITRNTAYIKVSEKKKNEKQNGKSIQMLEL